VRGWYLLTDEVGLTCVTLPSCQTIIDIEAAIDLLQQDVIDLNADVALKANTADISAVGFSNDYNDLDNKPTIPPAITNTSELVNDGEDGVNPFITAQDLPDTSGFVPYTGATQNVDLGTHKLSAKDLVINHSSGSGVAASITKGGAGEALTVNKTSGSGNAMSVTGGVTQLSELHLTTDLADAYIASAVTWNAKVPSTRTLTINGTTQDLSADRTFTIPTGLTVGTTPITSGTIGRVLFEGTGNVLQQSANLFFDETNSRFTLRSSTQPLRGFAQEEYSNTPSAASILFQKSRGTFASPVNVNANDLVGAFIFNARVNGEFTSDRCLFGANMASTTGIGMYFIAGSTNGNYFPDLYIHSSGNVIIGTTQSILTGVTDAGFKLDVNGNTRIKGSGATSATNGLSVLNSSLEEFLVVRNDGLIYSRGYNFWFSRQTATSAVANGSFLTGYRSSATGSYSFAANGGMEGIGGSSSATGNMSAVFGRNTSAYLTGQFAHSSYGVTQGGSQHSFVQLFRDIVGVSISELFINGSTLRATLPVANSIWVAKIYVNAVCNTAGGTTVLGAVFSGEYFVTLKRIGSTTTIVGTVSANEKADASMTTAIVLIDADDTNDSLRVQFTPPITAGATTAIRVMANLHLTELRY
jgi:hypothetical protein